MKNFTYEDHKKNKSNSKGYNDAVVEGAGPIGLYTSFKLFIEGISVTVVNDRSEHYTREQIILLDRKWIYQLRLILGTKFDKLFGGEDSIGKLLDNHVGLVIIKNLETVLMNRLKAFALYVDAREENQHQEEKSFLKLIYETAIFGIDLDHDKPLAVLGTPERQVNKAAKKYYRNLENKLMMKYNINRRMARKRVVNKKIRELKNLFGDELIPYMRDRDDEVNHITPEQYVELQINGNAFEIKNIEGVPLNYGVPRNYVGIPFDLFFCAGGANDRIRDELLEEPQVLTDSENYGLIIIDKADHNIQVTENDYTHKVKPMVNMLNVQETQEIYQFIINSHVISDQLKRRYDNIVNLILFGMVEDRYGHLIPANNSRNPEMLVLHIFELKQRITIGSITPRALSKFIEEIKSESNQNPNKWEYEEFVKELENKWAIAVFKYLLTLYHFNVDQIIIKTEENDEDEEGNQGLFHFKILSSNTFWIQIKGVKNPTKEYYSKNDSAIVVAVGDANTNAHFFTGSGLSTGKFTRET
uniref:Uncharacterized protein n=1 Tax=Meloidogyne javanica TaxID=6303 RepID=A0A915NDT9_MELJA